MEGHNSPTIAYECGDENIAPPAYAVDFECPHSLTPSMSPPSSQRYSQYPPVAAPRRLIVHHHVQQQSNHANRRNKHSDRDYNQPLMEAPVFAIKPKYQSVSLSASPFAYPAISTHRDRHNKHNHEVDAAQIVIASPPHHGHHLDDANHIAYPRLAPHPRAHQHIAPSPETAPATHNECTPPPHQDLLCLAVITFFFFPVFGLLAMCKASEANTAYSQGDYELAVIYNTQCKRYMKCAILFCIVIIVFAITLNMI